MPNLSASDYTTFIKLQAAQQAYTNNQIPRTIQTTAQPAATQSILNAQLLASQASFFVAPKKSALTSVARVRPQNPVQVRSNRLARSTLTWTSGTSGSVGSYTSSATNTGFGLPAKNKVGTYYRAAHTALPNTIATGGHASTVLPQNTLQPGKSANNTPF
jgi:hypothetical protein